ncbi:hypothetical protein ABT324_05200 [Saccharopolyspora sp. NPDC000359]|uniref:hypothetical protein n=1 Tax=Saccharopolyspora sp. NPDC000359 TaxID=3154251 RepID=UPI00331FFF2B
MTLPGPRKHLESISNDLDEGLSCVWLMPDEFVANGFADELLDELANDHDSLHVPEPHGAHIGGAAAAVPPIRAAQPRSDLPRWAQDTFSGLPSFDASPSPVAITVSPRTTSVTERIVQLLDLNTDEHPDEIRAIVTEPQLRGKVLVVCGWRERDRDSLAEVLVRLTSLVKEEGLPPAHRPRLLLATRERDLPLATWDRLDQMTTRIRWWWGVVGRLDTAVVVATARPRFGSSGSTSHVSALRELVAIDVITEVAGPDLRLAEYLAISWDGLVSSLGDSIEVSAREFGGEFQLGGELPRRGGNRPPYELRRAWRLGMADLWEHQVRVSPTAHRPKRTGTGLDAMIWRGQNRALMPILDEYRGRVEQVFRDRASRAVLADVTQQERPRGVASQPPRRSVLELGAMAWAVANKRVRLPRADNELLFSLLDVRNSLAHLQPITDDEVERLANALAGSRS